MSKKLEMELVTIEMPKALCELIKQAGIEPVDFAEEACKRYTMSLMKPKRAGEKV